MPIFLLHKYSYKLLPKLRIRTPPKLRIPYFSKQYQILNILNLLTVAFRRAHPFILCPCLGYSN